MNKINFDREMQKIISLSENERIKPSLLLHACCAPCSSACLERVKEHFNVTVYYYNPNIGDSEEYFKRANELIRLCKAMDVKCIIEEHDPDEFYSAVKGLEDQKEGGKRCEKCFTLRLDKTAEKAKTNGYDFFTTTLTVSPLKNADQLNAIGYRSAKKYDCAFLPSDFKKRGGYLRSIELSKKYELYRQNYCGCVFSENQRQK